MSEAITIGMIGVGGAILGALLVAFLQPIWTALITPKAKLTVQIQPFTYRLPNFLTSSIDAYRYNYFLNVRPTDQVREKLGKFSYLEGMILVTISNNSTMSIEGLALKTESGHDFISDLTIDGKLQDTFFGNLHEIGTLRAKSQCTVTVWTRSDIATSRWSNTKAAVLITATRFDQIRVVIPAPGYISRQYLLLSKKFVWPAFWLINVGWWIHVGVSAYVAVPPA